MLRHHPFQQGHEPLHALRHELTSRRTAKSQKNALAYWQGVRAEHLASGQAIEYGPEQIKKGDALKIGGHWREVVRANKKTVSITTGYSWTDRAPYTDIQGHRPAREQA